MRNAFLEILPAKFSVADFEKYGLAKPESTAKDGLKLVFTTEDEYCRYLNSLEDECNSYLSQYWIIKTPDLINKSKFIIKVLATLNNARSNYAQTWSC